MAAEKSTCVLHTNVNEIELRMGVKIWGVRNSTFTYTTIRPTMIVAYLFFASRYIGAVITIRKIGPPTASHSSHTRHVCMILKRKSRGAYQTHQIYLMMRCNNVGSCVIINSLVVIPSCSHIFNDNFIFLFSNSWMTFSSFACDMHAQQNRFSTLALFPIIFPIILFLFHCQSRCQLGP